MAVTSERVGVVLMEEPVEICVDNEAESSGVFAVQP